MKRLPLLANLTLLLVLALPRPASAQLRLPELVSDGMVMQRGAEVPVWGWFEAGEDVRVTFRGETYTATPDTSGAWHVTLPAMAAGGPYELTVAAGDEQVQVTNVLVGDVWVASGQSNMEWAVADAENAAQEIAAADDAQIRHFKVPLSWAEAPEETLAGGAWAEADPEHVGDFTAVGYYFARALREHVDVPIGLVNTSWGGSRIEPWMSADMLRLSEADMQVVLQGEHAREQRLQEALREKIGVLPDEDSGLVQGEARWAAPALDTSTWSRIAVPAAWEEAGYPGMDGVAWYRTTFDLSAEEARRPLRLGLGPIDDADISWVNGHEVGRTSGWMEPRVYEVPASALTPGENVIAVRVEDTGGGGGLYGDPALRYLETGGARRPLEGPWLFRVGAVSVSAGGQKNQLPTLLYNKMIYPLLDVPITGVLWYQGESNAGSTEEARAYRDLFAGMIEGWRSAWATEGGFPFLFVQLANFRPGGAAAADTSWAVLREAQHAALELPNTAEVVTIDIGTPDDIHPRNKQDVGARLARAARALAYGEDLVYSGPTYRSHEVLGDGRVAISFDHVGGGLEARGGALQGFTIAGVDGRFVPAEARIEEGRVVVQSKRVAEPVAVRYAWSNNPEDANLYNAEGLPASPFRTDAP